MTSHNGVEVLLRKAIGVGDLVVTPLKPTGRSRSPSTTKIALGVVTKGYRHRDDSVLAHVVSVAWKRTDVSLRADLLSSLNGLGRLDGVSKNDWAWRLGEVMRIGEDRGPRRIHKFVGQEFRDHKMSSLVAGVLEAKGFVTDVSPPGPDGGVDVLARRGRLSRVVQVKSGARSVGVKIARELEGVRVTQGAGQSLLVAWGGVTREARTFALGGNSLRVWESGDLLEAMFQNFDKLSHELRADLPLKQTWALVEDDE